MSIKHIRLGVNVLASGRHDAAWKILPDPASLSTDIDRFIAISQSAERALLDAIFLADGPGGLVEESSLRPWRALDPTVLNTALSQHTEYIGLVTTTTSLFGHPYSVARQIASLDYISKGRAAWNIITSQTPPALQAYGISQGWSQTERYERAQEFVQIVNQLWDSFPVEAIEANPDTSVFVNPDKLNPFELRGQHFSSRGALSVPRTPQGRPVIFQAGQSADSKAFGARYADALFTGQRILANAQNFYRETKGLAASYGRNPEHLLVMPGLFPILGSTDEEAQRHKRKLDDLLDSRSMRAELAHHLALDVEDLADLDAPLPHDKIKGNEALVPISSRWHRREMLDEAYANNWNIRELLFSNIIGGHRIYTGTPEGFAQNMVHWVDARAADGFNLNIDVQPVGLDVIADYVVPVLQREGRFRREYQTRTLREHLGLPTPFEQAIAV